MQRLIRLHRIILNGGCRIAELIAARASDGDNSRFR
jgi:integrase